jgi:hypothetical protein
MPEVTFCTFSSRPDNIQTPFKKIPEILTYMMLPIPSYECFEFREEFSIGFKSGEYGGRYNNLIPVFEHSSLIRSVHIPGEEFDIAGTYQRKRNLCRKTLQAESRKMGISRSKESPNPRPRSMARVGRQLFQPDVP